MCVFIKTYMSRTRIVLLDNDRQLIFGKDLGGVFESGMIYSVERIAGQIIFKEHGQMCLPINDEEAIKKGMSPLGGDFKYVVMEGLHLITNEEHEKEKNLS